ncbi:RagB/SusD family nutrient uptake outer membrane protein [Mangrovivirga cuniculi]|uniref:RagB/SusD family nutrient uptake outer membrane protein n=1 Tax=Mangrovivirga cuniculi TaxID=2715131 RepID=A0A4D7JQN1_9BACT|nr:RagB/SusD family nutrient uptake outer membrane protein [Mangrovivirga cuniculi]QCK17043.1 RagB/SusD family nutrient uptake outer membrane protein [Mangrovivirga cuniculi]
MKNLIFIKNISLILFISILVISACDVDEPLENVELSEETDYSQTENMVLFVNGAYGLLYNSQWETYAVLGVRGDDVNAAGDQAPLQEMDRYLYNPTHWMNGNTWINLYDDIIRWKGAIAEIEKYQEFAPNPAIGDQYIAEIKVMIGFEMLQIVRLWEDIIIPQSEFPQDAFDAGITEKEDALLYISNLMDEAIPNLPNVRPNERSDIPGGVTAYTALAVKALANLELKNWQGVTDATSEIINNGGFSLEPDYYNLWKIPGKLNDEILLEYQYSDFNQGSGEREAYLYAFFGPPSWDPAVEGISPGWGFWEPSIKYVKFMLDRGEELRLETNVLFTPDGIDAIQSDPDYQNLPEWISNVTRDGDVINNSARLDFLSGKHYLPSTQMIPGRTSYGSNKNFIAIRYAEILLIHAEAITMGATSSALTADEAVNLVRDRAGLLPISGVTLEDVIDEKFAEFGMEWGIRYYDLIRHDMFDELNYGGRTFQNPGDIYLPYPQAQVDLIPFLSND